MYKYLKMFYRYFQKIKNEKYLRNLIKDGLQVGDDVQINEGCFFDPSHCFLISIGNRCTLAPRVRLIAHDASTKNSLGFTKIGCIQIENDCFIGDSAIILPGVTVGTKSIIGAGSVVTMDIPSGVVAAGNPARIIHSLSDYLKIQKDLSKEGGILDKEFWIENLSNSQKQWVCEHVRNKIGFIE